MITSFGSPKRTSRKQVTVIEPPCKLSKISEITRATASRAGAMLPVASRLILIRESGHACTTSMIWPSVDPPPAAPEPPRVGRPVGTPGAAILGGVGIIIGGGGGASGAVKPNFGGSISGPAGASATDSAASESPASATPSGLPGGGATSSGPSASFPVVWASTPAPGPDPSTPLPDPLLFPMPAP